MKNDWILHKTHLLLLLLLFLLLSSPLDAKKFYDDDPMETVPPPRNVSQALSRKLSEYYDFFSNTFTGLGERQSKKRLIPAQEVNTLGEVPDSQWYTNRHYKHPMTVDELVRGVGNGSAPDSQGQWTVVAAKTEGITPGFTIVDSRGRRYVMKFDPLENPEITTSAEIISSKFFYALGYFVPENYLVEFAREQLVLGEDVLLRDAQGKPRKMTERDITEVLLNVPRTAAGKYRAVASLYVSGNNIGPFRYYGIRKDDPNDVIPHEHRRDLRGLSVFCAWLGHDDSRSINTQDFLQQEGGTQFVRHYLIDFGSTLGSASNGPNSPRSGFEYLFSWKQPAIQLFSLGLIVPDWAKARYPGFPSVGRFESEKFDAAGWMPEYPNPAFSNRLPDDDFWAAKQVMAFTDEQIRGIVHTGAYSDPRAEQWIADSLIARRDKIGKAFLPKLLPLDRFAVENSRLVFEDLGAKYGITSPQQYSLQWSRFDNDAETKTPISGETTSALPAPVRDASNGEYFAVDIRGIEPGKTIIVFLRKNATGVQVAGIERTW
jgi:hypothetical protein